MEEAAGEVLIKDGWRIIKIQLIRKSDQRDCEGNLLVLTWGCTGEEI